MARGARRVAGAVRAQGRPRVGVRTLPALAAALIPAGMPAAVWSLGAPPPVSAQVAGHADQARARIADLSEYVERGQAYGSTFVTFTIGLDGEVAWMDMGFMGRYRKTG